MIIKADAVSALRPEGGFKVDENGTVTYLIPNQTEPTEEQIKKYSVAVNYADYKNYLINLFGKWTPNWYKNGD